MRRRATTGPTPSTTVRARESHPRRRRVHASQGRAFASCRRSILSQGSDSASMLLNGLSVAFFIEVDDLIPTMVLTDAEMERAKAFLEGKAQGVREAAAAARK